jgi:hypothetical protein
MVGTATTSSRHRAAGEVELERELAALELALSGHGPTDVQALEIALGARYWGPGRFHVALREAVREGQLTHPSHGTYAAARGRDESAHP